MVTVTGVPNRQGININRVAADFHGKYADFSDFISPILLGDTGDCHHYCMQILCRYGLLMRAAIEMERAQLDRERLIACGSHNGNGLEQQL